MKIIASILFAIITTGLVAQGRVDGFFKGKGNSELVIGGGTERNNKFYAGTDKISLGRDINHVSIFAAYGITEKFDVYVSAPYIWLNDENSIQDGSVFLKYGLFSKSLTSGDLSVSLAAGYSTPLSDYETESINAIGQQAEVLDIRPVVHFMRNDGWFATLQGAYNLKSDPVPDAYSAALKVGKASSKIYYDFWYEYQYSDGGLDYRGTPAPETFRELGVGFHKIGGTFYQPIKSYLGYYLSSFYVLSGRNVGQGIVFNAGVVLKLNEL